MNLHIFSTEEEVDAAAAEYFISSIRHIPKPKIGLATGNTPIEFYKKLVSHHDEGRISFENMETYNLDEYAGLPPENPNSFAAFMTQHLFSKVDLPLSQRHIPRGDTEDHVAEAKRYNKLVEKASPLDIQLLSVGLNGHIGFNEPGTQLSAPAHVISLTEETRRVNSKSFSSIDKVPSLAITLGLSAILKAKTILFIAKGKEKAKILNDSFYGPVTTQVPGSFLQLHANLEVFLDEEAASQLINR